MYWSFIATNIENIREAAYGSKVKNPVEGIYLHVVATNEDGENVIEVSYNSILNLEFPYPTTLLRIMMWSMYNTNKVLK
ncbi:hypothetical protein BAE44_0013162 [Dichanthelium oligosanthes]|uniref:Uncharacterized protein n=1 Tax=Dichanthelium oligosanthes TaxID=888268 RepID=A0A1E5VL36_9POAL|nr:hypothetical protein BAE44_0013162 [Dichanthelium oligosanthes]